MSHIYLIGTNMNGPLKIGYSKNPEKRLKQLQTGHDEILYLFYKRPVDVLKPHILESHIHDANRHHKIHGEWYNLSVEEAKKEIEYAIIYWEK